MNFSEIDAERKKQGLTILELTRRARIAPSTYWSARKNNARTRQATLERLSQSLGGWRTPTGPHEAVRAQYRARLAYVARELGLDPVDVLNSPGVREYWKPRAHAMALVVADLDIPHSELGRALGLSKQIVNWNIKQALAMAEHARLAWFSEKSGRLQEATP